MFKTLGVGARENAMLLRGFVPVSFFWKNHAEDDKKFPRENVLFKIMSLIYLLSLKSKRTM